MADLKVGTTIGGSPVWHQGNLPLVPSGIKILYKGARIYSEADKPTANELNMVSRDGDTINGILNITNTTPYKLILKSPNAATQNLIRFEVNNVLHSYVGQSATGFTVAMASASGAFEYTALDIDKVTRTTTFAGDINTIKSGNFDLKYNGTQYIRVNNVRDMYIGTPGSGDIHLGFKYDGMGTKVVRLRSELTWENTRTLVNSDGYIQRSAMDNPYFNQTEADGRFLRKNVNALTDSYLLTKSVDYTEGQPSGYSGFFRNNSIADFKGLTIHVAHPGYVNGAYSRGITFDYGGSNRLYTYAFDTAGNKQTNVKIYTESDKPTPGELGALEATANAVSASKLATGRRISLGGDASGSVVFDGSGDVTLPVTVLNDSHEHSGYVKKSGDVMSGDLTLGQLNANSIEVGNITHKARIASANDTVYLQMGSVAPASDNTVVIAGWAAAPLNSIGFKMADTKSPYVEWNGARKPIFHRDNAPTLGSDLGLQWSTQSPGGTAKYIRLVVLGLSDTDTTFIMSGYGDHATPRRASYSVSAATRTNGISVEVNALDVDLIYGAKPRFYHRRVDDTFEVWFKTPAYNLDGTFTRMSGRGGTVTLDSVTQTEPTGLTEVTVNQIYTTRFKPTAADINALPSNGNAVSATRLQTARLISGVPFDGTSNITISASNVGALPITGGTITGAVGITHEGIGLTIRRTQYPNLVLESTNSTDARFKYFEVTGTGGLNIITRRANGTNNGVVTIETGQDGVVYHTGNKPTPADIGAVSKSGDTITGLLTVVGAIKTGGLRYYASTTNLGLTLSSNGSGYSEIVRNDNNVEEWDNGIRAYGGADWRIGTNRIYHQGFKPTPADIDAVSNSGDTITGQMRYTGLFNGTSNQAQIAHLGTDASQSLFIRNMREHISSAWIWEKVYNGSLYYSTGTTGAGTSRIRMNVSGAGEIYLGNADKRVYHEGYETTPAKIGALSLAGGTITGGLTVTDRINANGGIAAVGSITAATVTATGNITAVGSVNVNGNLRTTGAGGWINDTYGGGWNMSDTTWIRSHGGKKVHVSNLDDNAIDTTGGITVAKGLTLGGKASVSNLDVRGGYMSLTSGSNTLLEFHSPGKSAAMIYKEPDGNLRFVTSNGSGGENAVRMVLDTGGNLGLVGALNAPVVNASTVNDSGNRVYSASNPIPDSVIMRSVTNAGVGAVGSYAMITILGNIGQQGPGVVLQGHQVAWANAEGTVSSVIGYGQWRLMGWSKANADNGWGSWNVTLAQRIA